MLYAREQKMTRYIGMTSHTNGEVMAQAIQRHDLDCRCVGTPRERAPQKIAGLANLALAGEKHEDVAGRFAP